MVGPFRRKRGERRSSGAEHRSIDVVLDDHHIVAFGHGDQFAAPCLAHRHDTRIVHRRNGEHRPDRFAPADILKLACRHALIIAADANDAKAKHLRERLQAIIGEPVRDDHIARLDQAADGCQEGVLGTAGDDDVGSGWFKTVEPDPAPAGGACPGGSFGRLVLLHFLEARIGRKCGECFGKAFLEIIDSRAVNGKVNDAAGRCRAIDARHRTFPHHNRPAARTSHYQIEVLQLAIGFGDSRDIDRTLLCQIPLRRQLASGRKLAGTDFCLNLAGKLEIGGPALRSLQHPALCVVPLHFSRHTNFRICFRTPIRWLAENALVLVAFPYLFASYHFFQ